MENENIKKLEELASELDKLIKKIEAEELSDLSKLSYLRNEVLKISDNDVYQLFKDYILKCIDYCETYYNSEKIGKIGYLDFLKKNNLK